MLKPVHRTPQVSLSSCLPSTFARETCALSHLPGLVLPVPILNTVYALGSPPEQIFSLLTLPVSLKKTSALPCLFIPSPVASSAGQGKAGRWSTRAVQYAALVLPSSQKCARLLCLTSFASVFHRSLYKPSRRPRNSTQTCQ